MPEQKQTRGEQIIQNFAVIVLSLCLHIKYNCVVIAVLKHLHAVVKLSSMPQARPAWDDGEYLDIALDITAGLRYLESKKYVHR